VLRFRGDTSSRKTPTNLRRGDITKSGAYIFAYTNVTIFLAYLNIVTINSMFSEKYSDKIKIKKVNKINNKKL